jgi:hypothetical protein
MRRIDWRGTTGRLPEQWRGRLSPPLGWVKFDAAEHGNAELLGGTPRRTVSGSGGYLRSRKCRGFSIGPFSADKLERLGSDSGAASPLHALGAAIFEILVIATAVANVRPLGAFL